MWIKGALALVFISAVPAAAEGPLSAIDWLSKSVQEKPVIIAPQDPVASEATTSTITVTTLGAISKDTVGLLPTAVSGLPGDFWGRSTSPSFRAVLEHRLWGC